MPDCPGHHRVISIHALREEGDARRWPPQSLPLCGFLSTPSVRRATHWDSPQFSFRIDFYPRPP